MPKIYEDKSYVSQLEDSIVKFMPLEFALSQFVLPILVISTRHQKYPFLYIFIDQIYILFL